MASSQSPNVLARLVTLAHRLPWALVESVCAAIDQAAASRDVGTIAQATALVIDNVIRDELTGIIRVWLHDHPIESLSSLAWALRAAAATDQAWRDSTSLELVWTGPAPPVGALRRTGQALLEVVHAARGRLWLVAFAGYRLPDVARALQEAADRSVQIALIIESPEASQGKVTFSVLEGLGHRLADFATVYLWPLDKRRKDDLGRHGSLHVKCALADDDLLFVTSANLTEYAVELNMELGLLVRGGDTPKLLAEHLRWLIAQRHLVPIGKV